MDQETLAQVNRFLQAVGKQYCLRNAILFGSRARGDHFAHSDVDLLLVSEDFAGIAFPDRPSRLYTFWEGDLPLEMLCYTPEEFEHKRRMIGLVQEATTQGLALI